MSDTKTIKYITLEEKIAIENKIRAELKKNWNYR